MATAVRIDWGGARGAADPAGYADARLLNHERVVPCLAEGGMNVIRVGCDVTCELLLERTSSSRKYRREDARSQKAETRIDTCDVKV